MTPSDRNHPDQLKAALAPFELAADRDDRAQILIGYADRYRPVPADVVTPPYPKANQVPYCESDAYVWILSGKEGGVALHIAVENPQGVSAKALAAILKAGLEGLPPETVARVCPDLVYEIFGRNVSMGKGQGLTAMVAMIREAAATLAAEESDTAPDVWLEG